MKLWKLLYRQPIPTWHRGRLLLIGDAAHPMLPRKSPQPTLLGTHGHPSRHLCHHIHLHHRITRAFKLTDPRTDQGQAGAQSIEDGAAIGVLLQGLHRDSPKLGDEIERRLEAFELVRRKRASLMQIFSNAGQDEAEKIRDEAARLLGDGLKVPSK